MGRFREDFAGKRITFRVPFTMAGEMVVANGQTGIQFPDSTFLNSVDKPFEIHRMIPRITPFNNAAIPVIAPPNDLATMPTFENILGKYVKLRMIDLSKNEAMGKTGTLISDYSKTFEQTWEWDEPYTLVRAEGMQVTVDNNCPNFVLGATQVNNLRIEIVFEGYLLVIAPASETR